MALISTSQVGGRPWPSVHLISPACTVSSSFNGLLWKHACISAESSCTPSRTALPLPAAFLLTYVRRSMRWSGRSTETARHFNLRLNFLLIMQLTALTNDSLWYRLPWLRWVNDWLPWLRWVNDWLPWLRWVNDWLHDPHVAFILHKLWWVPQGTWYSTWYRQPSAIMSQAQYRIIYKVTEFQIAILHALVYD